MFEDDWHTTFGALKLVASGKAGRLRGEYHYGATVGRLEGEVRGRELRFRYEEPAEHGEGVFRIVRSGCFRGGYLAAGAQRWRDWNGSRGWDGLWETDFGRLRIQENRGTVRGWYDSPSSSTLEGRVAGDKLTVQFRETSASGEARFERSADGCAFGGEWRRDGKRDWLPWNGHRVDTVRGITWLVVLEAYWQRRLVEPEFAFGNMLREVFARLPQVRVRQRYFHDAQGLEDWCREAMFLAEPVVLVVASHGQPMGVTVRGKIVDTRRVMAALKPVENLQLLHFSSCLVGQDAGNILGRAAFPVSGYTTSVDWGASALLELTYLDLVLNRGLPPAEAAHAIPKIVPYAGDEEVPGSPYPPAGFRFFPATPPPSRA